MILMKKCDDGLAMVCINKYHNERAQGQDLRDIFLKDKREQITILQALHHIPKSPDSESNIEY
jgi:hypothetical protein